MKRFSALVFASSLALSATPAFAATFLIPEQDELFISIPIIDDVYAFGAIVAVEENIEGDLIAAGAEVRVDGDIKEDMTVAGSMVVINGSVGDDLRIAGGDVRIAGEVKGDLLIGGGRVTIEKDATISGDVHMAGGDLAIDGIIEGGLQAYGGRITIRGSVEEDAIINADELRIDGFLLNDSQIVAGKLTLGSNALLDGNIQYWTKDGEVDFGAALKSGTATYDPELHVAESPKKFDKKDGLKFAAVAFIGFSLLSTALLLIILILLTKTFFTDTAKRLIKAPSASFFTGLLYFIVTPILAFALCATIIGLPIGLFIGFLFIFSAYFANALTSIVLAKWLEIRQKWHPGKVKTLLCALIIFVVLHLLAFVPILGWLAGAAAVCFAFGALIHTKWTKMRKLL